MSGKSPKVKGLDPSRPGGIRWKSCVRDGEDLIFQFIAACDSGDLTSEWFVDMVEDVRLAFGRYDRHEVSTLDEAFGLQRPDGYRRSAAEERDKKRRRVQIVGRVLRDCGAAVDSALFEVLAEIHGTNRTKATEWYYEANKSLPPRGFSELPEQYRRFVDQLNWVRK